MDVIVERVAALDVHKASVTGCVRNRPPTAAASRIWPSSPRRFVRCWRCRWPAAHGVTQVVMEATGVYWKPVWHILEDDFELMLVNARHVKQGSQDRHVRCGMAVSAR